MSMPLPTSCGGATAVLHELVTCQHSLCSGDLLSESNTDDTTMEPTKKRVSAINYFHSLAGHPPPSGDPFVQGVVQGIKNRLGDLGIPRQPISQADIR